jgi:hypothetical protein
VNGTAAFAGGENRAFGRRAKDYTELVGAGVLELVDRHGSGPCARKSVEVRILSPALFKAALGDGCGDAAPS